MKRVCSQLAATESASTASEKYGMIDRGKKFGYDSLAQLTLRGEECLESFLAKSLRLSTRFGPPLTNKEI
jgi:hypothetical protein